jgi:hypothetical protein
MPISLSLFCGAGPVRPGPEMGRALAYAHNLRLAGADKAEQLQGTLEWLERGRDGHA